MTQTTYLSDEITLPQNRLAAMQRVLKLSQDIAAIIKGCKGKLTGAQAAEIKKLSNEREGITRRMPLRLVSNIDYPIRF